MNGGTVASTHHYFSTAVLVPVVGHDILLIVLKVTHIGAAVDPPQTGAVQLQTLHDAILLGDDATHGRAVLGERLGNLALVVELHQDFQLAVAIDIGTTGVIGHQRTLDTLVRQFDFLIACRPRLHLSRRRQLCPTDNSRNGIAVRRGACRIGIVRHTEGCSIQLHTVTVHIVGHIVVLLGKNAPVQVDAAAYLHSHEATIQLVGDTLSADTDCH